MERQVKLEEELISLHDFRDGAFDQISEMMVSLVNWKRFVEKFENMRTDFLEQAQKLALREKKLVEDSSLLEQREKEVEVKIKRFGECVDELAMKKKELELIRTQMEDYTAEFNRDLNSKKQEVGKCNMDLNLKKQELSSVKMDLEQCYNEIFLKKEELSKVQKSLEECTVELETEGMKLDFCKRTFQECSKEVSASHEKLELVKESLQDYCKKLEHKEKELQKMENQISKNKSELQLNEQKLVVLQDMVTSSSVEINWRYKELEGTLKSIKDSEKDLDLKRKEHEHVQTLAEESKKEFDLLQKELSGIHKLIEDRSRELTLKELELNSIKQLIEDYYEELEVKEKQHDIVSKAVNQCNTKLKLKEKELALIEKSLKENSEKRHVEDEKLDSIQQCRENEEQKLGLLEESIKSYEEIKMKEQELNAVQISILDRQKELELEEALLEAVKSTFEETTAELISMMGERMSVHNSIMKCSKELELEQSRLDSVRKSLEECCNELSSKEVQQSVVQIMCCEYLGELQERKAYFDSLNRKLEERVKELQKEEKQIEGNVNKLNSMKQKFDFGQETLEGWREEAELERKQKSTMCPSPQNIEECNSSFISLSRALQCCMTGNGSKLQMLLNEQLRKNDLVHFEIFEFIKMSPDPAKLVLDAMQGFHPAGLSNGHMGFDLDVVRRSCVTLLEQVVKIAPQIEPHTRNEAMRLAMEWKEKMKPGHESSLEALAFLELLAAYKLDYAFAVDELCNLLEVVECKQKRDIYKALGKGIRHEDIKHAKWSDCNPLCSSSTNCHSNATGTARSPELLLSDPAVDQDLSINEVCDGIQFSPDPARLVLDVMRGSYFRFWNNGRSGFGVHLVRNIVLLLEQLMNISPKVSFQVKETALQQVILWQENISTDAQNSLEVLAFLMFLAVYDLVSYFKRDEILILVETVVHHKQAPKTCQALGFTNEIAGLAANLIQRKQFLEAARFSRAFELSVKFLPETILKSYLQKIRKDGSASSYENNSFEEQCNIIDREAAALREFVECVVDCKLESVFPPGLYMSYIAERQVMKTRLAQPFSAPPYMAQQAQQHHMAQQSTQLMQDRDPFIVGTSNPSYQQFLGTRKRPKFDTSGR